MGETYRRGTRHSNGSTTHTGSGDSQVVLCSLSNYSESEDNWLSLTSTATVSSYQGSGDSHFSLSSKTTQSPSQRAALRAADREDRESLVLWRRPITTLQYFMKETFLCMRSLPSKIWERKIPFLLLIVTAFAIFLLNKVPGPHLPVLKWAQTKFLWCAYWFGLGVLSSIGLGTGLHTFLLYLGPHIASVTLAAYECGALNFPEPPYPDEIICPQYRDPEWPATMWNIMCKVYLEAMMWGAGTAAGELPPYFMARAARVTGYDPQDEDELREFEEFQKKRQLNPESLTYIEQLKVMIENLVQRVGFFGILACASIPNPLFDLAGLTCGHFLVPFWTFFGATLIGKAVIKMLIQQTFVILAFNEALIAKAVNSLGVIPVAGKLLQQPLKEFLAKQKERFHHKRGTADVDLGGNWISKLIEWFSISMFLYFIVSLINAFAQSHHKRLRKQRTQKESKD